LSVRASNSALITFATSFALITSFLKNSLIMLIMKSRWGYLSSHTPGYMNRFALIPARKTAFGNEK
jgi:hypothetical protein